MMAMMQGMSKKSPMAKGMKKNMNSMKGNMPKGMGGMRMQKPSFSSHEKELEFAVI